MTSFDKFLRYKAKRLERDIPADEKGFYAEMSRLGCRLYTALAVVGEYAALALMFLASLFLKLFVIIKNALKKLFKKIGSFFKARFGRYGKALKSGRTEVEHIREEKGFFAGVLAEFKFVGRILFGKRGIAVTAFNYALPIVCCVFLFNIVSYATSRTYALKLTVNGNFIGYVEDETVFTDAEQLLINRINYTGSDTESVNFTHEYELSPMSYGTTPSTKYQIADRMLRLLGEEVEQGFGLYIGGDYYGTLLSHDKLDKALEEILDKYRTDNETETVAFDKEVSFVSGLYLADSFVDESDIIDLVISYKQVATYYTAVLNDSPYMISKKVGMTIAELSQLNPGFSLQTSIHIGDEIKITQEQPFMNVVVTRQEQYEETIPYETEYVSDNSRYVGMKVIKREGKNGTQAVTANVSYLNGVEISRTVLVRTTTKEPVNKIINVGTLPRPANSAPGTVTEAGKFIWPVGGSGGKKGYGFHAPGYANHSGLDIIAPYGTPIYAAESGTVTSVYSGGGWGSGWGNHIVIQHSNGISTRYAHCSAIASGIRVGTKVTAGQVIGYVGSTGDSTGNHLHFEVMVGGVRVNPIGYLPKHN